jgi:hypothetical protein
MHASLRQPVLDRNSSSLFWHERVAHQRDGAIRMRAEAGHGAKAKSLRNVFRVGKKFFRGGKLF